MPKPPFVLRLLPSMTDAAFVLPLVFLFGGLNGAQTLLSDGDTGWHLRTGQWILTHGRVPDHDLFSFTRASQPWYAWEWLWDVMFGWLHLHYGMAAVLLASSLVLALTFALLFRLARWKCGNALAALALTLLAAAASSGHWLARPHLFTMLFIVLFYGVLERSAAPDCGASRTRKLLWLLPPLMVLWTNLHGGFVAGIILVAGYAAAEFGVLLREATAGDRRQALVRGRRYLLAAIGCGLATFINPYGYRLHAHIIAYLSDSFYTRHVMEFQPLDFQSGQARYFEIMLLVGAAAAFVALRRGRLVWPLLLVVWGHLSMYSARHVEIFVLLAAVPGAALLAEGIEQASTLHVTAWLRRALVALGGWMQELNVLDRAPRWHLASLLTLLALGAAFQAPRAPPRYRAEYDPKSYPAAATSVLEKAGPAQRIFTPDLWGGYLIYRGYPQARVFMDGRSDFYGPEFSKQYINALQVHPGWEQYLKRYGVNTILLPPDAALAGALRQSKAWQLVYDDGVAVIFRSSQPAAA